MTIYTTVCSTCKLLIVNFGEEDIDKIYSCKAFPNGVPSRIVFYGFDHRKFHLDGDNGIIHQSGKPTIIKSREDYVAELGIANA